LNTARVNGTASDRPAGERPTILVVEDEWLIAMDIEGMLEDAGFAVCGPAGRVDEALALIETRRVDLGLLDVNLAGQQSYPVAAALREKGRPFLFLSGHSEAHLHDEFRDERLINKPIEPNRLIRLVEEILAVAPQ